ncbi:hypothetical protein TK90_2812 (plasmid) [Thioalkalivibrio sp. K90mix]|uniref:thioredoxin fold domain-containing protein n=1 Tax=Thioalkalivibrio sp. (strain K90mix) TaxID=396595 RepID=UPI0001C65CC3|nr:thioredoxin fold domain-containing protein [Thioalkalivibrio sp. K90mix]ADC73297.1 hypothetical protein TK90_2812 [Thioalkalivibrio sp. K90mix]
MEQDQTPDRKGSNAKPSDDPEALDDAVESDTGEDAQNERPRSRRKRARDYVDAAEGTLIPNQISPGKMILVGIVFALLYLLSSDFMTPYITGERSYEQIVSSGTVEEGDMVYRRAVEREFEDWTRIRYEASASASEHRGRITMLVDPVCPYCRRAFDQTQEMVEAGISVDYVVVPTRLSSELSMESAESVYCAAIDERRDAFESEMNEEPYLARECEIANILEVQMERARELGANGTRPWTVLEDGRVVVGHRPMDEWRTILDAEPSPGAELSARPERQPQEPTPELESDEAEESVEPLMGEGELAEDALEDE